MGIIWGHSKLFWKFKERKSHFSFPEVRISKPYAKYISHYLFSLYIIVNF